MAEYFSFRSFSYFLFEVVKGSASWSEDDTLRNNHVLIENNLVPLLRVFPGRKLENLTKCNQDTVSTVIVDDPSRSENKVTKNGRKKKKEEFIPKWIPYSYSALSFESITIGNLLR